MDDTISRQAAVEAIKDFKQGAAEWRDEQEERSDIWHRADSAVASALEIGLRIKKLPSAQPDGYVKIPESGIEDLSDGFHTYRQLYYQRMMLFATIVRQNREKAWKSLKHEDGELCFGGGWFIVGIDTPEGSYTYHYEDNFYSLFDCEELECGKHWDGHTEKDVTRLLSLPSAQPEITEDAINDAHNEGYDVGYWSGRRDYEPKWIPVTERLPDLWDERYLVSLAWGGVGVMEYKSTGFHNYGSFSPVPIETVTAWMPLPEPYREETEDEESSD